MMETYLKKRVSQLEGIFVDHKKMLEEFHKNSKGLNKEDWEWYRTILVEGRNEIKITLGDAMDELKYFRDGMNPPYLYKIKTDDSIHTEAR